MGADGSDQEGYFSEGGLFWFSEGSLAGEWGYLVGGICKRVIYGMLLVSRVIWVDVSA